MDPLPVLNAPIGDPAVVTANYNKLSDHIRRLTPQGIQCSVFCGGVQCKYENPESWTADSLAIQGLYSHWITHNILAMARPSTVLIVQKNIIQQFQSLGIKSIINLQCPREHASCGQPLESSGFSYDPNIFMENNIYYYNFAWKDYGDATLIGLLNMVKVVAFAETEGRVAIHCHAGLGRTGVLIACYLIYSLRVPANTAIKYVRLKRPGSVQTRGQIFCVRHFAHYILPNLITYYIKEHSQKDKFMCEFTLSRFLKRQKIALHGYEERNYKYLPKIIHKICERILKLCGCWIDDFALCNVPYTTDFFYNKVGANVKRHESIYSLYSNIDELTALNSLNSPSCSAEILTITSAPSSPNPSEVSETDTISDFDEELHKEMLAENKCFQELELEKAYKDKSPEEPIVIHDINEVVDTLSTLDVCYLSLEQKAAMKAMQADINASRMAWVKLDTLNDIRILVALLYDWLESLKRPVLDIESLEVIVIHYKHSDLCFTKLKPEVGYLIEYLLLFVSKLQTSAYLQMEIIRRLIASLTQQYLTIRENVVPSGRNFRKLRDGTYGCLTEFFLKLFDIIDVHHRNRTTRLDESMKTYNNLDVETGFHDDQL